jgi:hypothetical protein
MLVGDRVATVALRLFPHYGGPPGAATAKNKSHIYFCVNHKCREKGGIPKGVWLESPKGLWLPRSG